MNSNPWKIGFLLGIVLIIFLSINSLNAHQPRLETGKFVSLENPIIVENPEISQAFYGELEGNPDYFQIKSDQPFQLYVNLLVPTTPGQEVNLSLPKSPIKPEILLCP